MIVRECPTSSRRRRWPWWARRELILPYLAFAGTVTAIGIGAGYWLMHLVVAWRMG